MPSVKIVNQSGKDAGTINLDDSVFGAEKNIPLIHQVAVAQYANKRQGTKSTLTRSEVAGGGRKPWRQKGTGNARQGSIRAPQWKHGGIVFAPKPRDFSQKINKRMKEAAFRSAISGKLADEELRIVDKFEVSGKTKEMAAIATALEFGKNVLMVVTENDTLAVRASANLPGVSTAKATDLSVFDIVNYAQLVLTAEAAKSIEEAYKV